MIHRMLLSGLLLALIIPLVRAADQVNPTVVPDKAATRHNIDALITRFQSTKSKATLGLVQESIDLSISYGAPAWNQRDHKACCDFYIQTAQSLIDAFPEGSATAPAVSAIADLKSALVRASQTDDVDRKAWTLRYAFDKTALAGEMEAMRASALIELGGQYLGRDDFDDAQDAFSSATAMLTEWNGLQTDRIPQVFQVARFASANALVGQKKYHEAADAVAKGVETLPGLAGARIDLHTLYGSPLTYEAIMKDIKSQAAREPKDASLQFLLGYEYYFTGDKEAARPLFEKTLTLDPKFSAAQLFLNALSGEALPPPKSSELLRRM